MPRLQIVKRFKREESGAVTVDWVVLTAAIFGHGLTVLAAVSGGLGDLSNEINDTLSEYGPVSFSF